MNDTLFDDFLQAVERDFEAVAAAAAETAAQEAAQKQEKMDWAIAATWEMLGEEVADLLRPIFQPGFYEGQGTRYLTEYQSRRDVAGYTIHMRILTNAGGIDRVELSSDMAAGKWWVDKPVGAEDRVRLARFWRAHLEQSQKEDAKKEDVRQRALESLPESLAQYVAGVGRLDYWSYKIDDYERDAPGSRAEFEARSSQRQAALDWIGRLHMMRNAAEAALRDEMARIDQLAAKIRGANLGRLQELLADNPAVAPTDVWEIAYPVVACDGEGQLYVSQGTSFSLCAQPDNDGYYTVLDNGVVVKRRYPAISHITFRPNMPLSDIRSQSRVIEGRTVRFSPHLTTKEVDTLVKILRHHMAPAPEYPVASDWMRAWATKQYGLSEEEANQLDF